MNKYLKYLLSLFLAFVLIANDGTLDSQTKSAEYYQSSFVILRRELDLTNSRLYVLNRFVSLIKIAFLIPVHYLELKQVYSFQIRILIKLRMLIYQNINSFIRQSVFMNEIITSNNFYKSLYSA
ncbi:hypothetical protein SGQ44_00945 [Flavobacterium sp. Fl-77]|uniref:Uncharacterized protein n=1 Tax=Flavobacterium flavipigmentatum TaxID=2893884 RepID=A0AAJ2VZS6_9FLAO|nr:MULTISPECIES: hypothetical protein [unclassified Flavobacterium]MDX6180700.1 hypothetical protein [Flavobacterium sp. Fl-33]MDX6184300.1 hypothetical protein [Flavobacterium sp. Fl-77]